MASSSIKNVILVGAGGNLGPPILKALDDDPQFNVSILTRSSSKSTFPSHIKVHRVNDSYPENELVEAFKGQDAVISTVALGGVLQQIPMIDAAVKAGVKRFLPAEYGGNKSSPKVTERLSFLNSKEKVLTHLKSQEEKGLSWTGIATGPFFDWGLKNGFLGFDLKSQKAMIYGSGDVTWSATKLSTIGLAVARALLKPEERCNKFLYISSVSTTQNELLATLQKQTAKEWAVERTTIEETIRDGKEKLSKGDRRGAFSLILSTMFEEGMGSDFTKDVDSANGLLGLPEENIYDLVQESCEQK